MEKLNNAGSERALISILVNNSEEFTECIGKLYSKDFYFDYNALIYNKVMELYSKDIKELDHVLLWNQFTEEDKKLFEDVKGIDYIKSLFLSRLKRNINVYIDTVIDLSNRRKAILEATSFIEEVKDISNVNIQESVLNLPDKLLNVLTKEDNEPINFSNVVEEYMEEFKENDGDLLGYGIGWEKFDEVGQGINPENELIIFGATAKTGKSTILMNISQLLCKIHNLKVLYIDTEMTSKEQFARLCAQVSGVPSQNITSGKYLSNERELEAVNKAKEEIKNYDFYHYYMPNFSIKSVQALIKQYKKRYNIDVVVFDYIKMPSADASKLKYSQEYQQLSLFCSSLKELSGKLKLPILSASQLNRSAEGNTDLGMGAIGGSAGLLHLASKFYFLRRKTQQELQREGSKRGNLKLEIYAQRHGSSQSEAIDLLFEPAINKIKEI